VSVNQIGATVACHVTLPDGADALQFALLRPHQHMLAPLRAWSVAVA
jgi:hypothetical protein